MQGWAACPPSAAQQPRLITGRREGERVTPLELFFDLVFVLAITQCTALMSHHPTWAGLGQGLLVLGVLWWGWVGYAWLTSVLDPDEVASRLAIFVAMAAMLIVALCVPDAFGNLALTFALAFGVFRAAHIALFMLASADEDGLRHSVLGLAGSTAIAVGLLAAASLFDGLAQAALWALALFLDMGGPYFFGSEGWRLVPGHFAERHGLIVIIALGESIVAIGVGASGALDLGIGTAAVLGVALAAALWWTYFDVVYAVSARRLARGRPAGRATSSPATPTPTSTWRWSPASSSPPSGSRRRSATAAPTCTPCPPSPCSAASRSTCSAWSASATATCATVNRHRLGLAIVLLLLIPVATAIPALLTLAVVDLLLVAMIFVEHRGYGEGRAELRRETGVGQVETA